MRSLLPLIGLLIAAPSQGQLDIQQRLKERLQKNQTEKAASPATTQVKVEADDTPFTPNTFIGSFRMVVHTYTKGKEDKDSPMELSFWSSADKTLMQASDPQAKSGGDVKMLTDHKGKWTYMLVTDERGSKTGMKMPKQKITVLDDDEDEGDGAKINVTSETRMIEGHSCTKVIVTDEDGVTTAWVAQDLGVSFADLFGAQMNQGNMRGKKPTPEGFDGFPLEFETVSHDGKERSKGSIHDLQIGKVDGSVFSTDGYEIMELPIGMPMGE